MDRQSSEDSVENCFSSDNDDDREQDDILALSTDKLDSDSGMTGLTEREKKERIKMKMINSRLDNLIEVLD
jgi:hypothetical protein